VEFEYDPKKSKQNQKKHGIDFEEAQCLWEDEDRILFPGRSDIEDRYALIGRMGQKIWVAIFTLREERIRLISVRRARENEVEVYES
jgi:uncharacterized DUF497 family protein